MNFIKKYLDLFLITVVWGVIVVANFSLDTWLTGWDNLHPEFDLGVNVHRSIFSVWQEYQGLGLVGIMGHASDLPRQIFLAILEIFLPTSWLRQMYFFLMLLVGSCGTYFLAKRNLFSALFYLLSLVMVQMFYVPFEPFAAHFGFLPWLMYSAILLANRFNLRRVIFFAAITILALPQAYVPTVFLVYLLILGTIVIFKKSWIILAFALAINAFWLLPFSYSTLVNLGVPGEAKINQMSTERTYLQNQKFGDFYHSVTLQNFWLDNSDFGFRQSNGYIMQGWRDHLVNPMVILSGIILFACVLFGIVVSFKRKISNKFLFLTLFLISFTAIASATTPFSWIDSLLNNLPLFSQVFRSPFTKFSILLSLMFAVYFGLGLKYLNKKIVYIGALSALVLYALPVFQGRLFYKQEKINIPIEYFQTFDYFSKQKLSTRIANFPQPTYWGWGFENWGYGGSGFLWYGISQPILDRTFDVWSRENENYYWEISYALYSKNLTLFENVLEKYRVNWLLLDENIVNPQSPKALFNDELKELIARSDKFVQLAKFGKISIYGVNLTRPTKDFVSIATELPGIEPEYKWGNLDQAFVDFGDYVSTKKLSDESLIDFGGSGSSSEICLSSKRMLAFLDRFVNGSGCGPDGNRTRGTLLDKQIPDQPRPTPQDSIAEVYYPFRTLFTGKRQEDLEFDPTTIPAGEQKVFELNSMCEDSSGKTTECATIYLPDLVHDSGYIVSIESNNLEGLPLSFWVENLNSRKSDLETYLPKGEKTSWFVLPPMEVDGLGYALHFDSVSVGREKVVNEVGQVTVASFDYQGMVTQKVGEVGGLRGVGYLSVGNFSVLHPNPSWYQIDLKHPGENLILAQSFENGWIAWDQDLRFLEHKKINNWANGWELSGSEKSVYIFFWPQILEFIGFGILGLFILTALSIRFWVLHPAQRGPAARPKTEISSAE